MSIVLPFLAILVVGAFAASHRLRLAVWAAAAITLLVACWLLGANQAATITAGVLVFDAEGRIDTVNPGATRILRLPLSAWRGRRTRSPPAAA